MNQQNLEQQYIKLRQRMDIMEQILQKQDLLLRKWENKMEYMDAPQSMAQQIVQQQTQKIQNLEVRVQDLEQENARLAKSIATELGKQDDKIDSLLNMKENRKSNTREELQMDEKRTLRQAEKMWKAYYDDKVKALFDDYIEPLQQQIDQFQELKNNQNRDFQSESRAKRDFQKMIQNLNSKLIDDLNKLESHLKEEIDIRVEEITVVITDLKNLMSSKLQLTAVQLLESLKEMKRNMEEKFGKTELHVDKLRSEVMYNIRDLAKQVKESNARETKQIIELGKYKLNVDSLSEVQRKLLLRIETESKIVRDYFTTTTNITKTKLEMLYETVMQLIDDVEPLLLDRSVSMVLNDVISQVVAMTEVEWNQQNRVAMTVLQKVSVSTQVEIAQPPTSTIQPKEVPIVSNITEEPKELSTVLPEAQVEESIITIPQEQISNHAEAPILEKLEITSKEVVIHEEVIVETTTSPDEMLTAPNEHEEEVFEKETTNIQEQEQQQSEVFSSHQEIIQQPTQEELTSATMSVPSLPSAVTVINGVVTLLPSTQSETVVEKQET